AWDWPSCNRSWPTTAAAPKRKAYRSRRPTVEDYLVQLSVLDEESGVQREALESAREALGLAENQYKAGTVDYTDVVTNPATALSNERTGLT
ncbi:TolC family protein, partial [Pseudomonas aeruginosa]